MELLVLLTTLLISFAIALGLLRGTFGVFFWALRTVSIESSEVHGTTQTAS